MNLTERKELRDGKLADFFMKQAPRLDRNETTARFWEDDQTAMRSQLAKFSRERLNAICNHIPFKVNSVVVKDILGLYDYSEEDIDQLGPDYSYLYESAFAHIAEDVLIRSFIKPNGDPSDMVLHDASFFDPTRYVASVRGWRTVSSLLEGRLWLEAGVFPKEQLTQDDEIRFAYEIFKLYEKHYGPDSVIVLPRRINITQEGVSIDPAIPDPRDENIDDRHLFGLIYFPHEIVETNNELVWL
jgi:hypothetical protein